MNRAMKGAQVGYIAHHTIVVTGGARDVAAARAVGLALFAESAARVSEVTDVAVNGTASFFVAPDGSKEWWADSDRCDCLRAEFIAVLRREFNTAVDWVEVRFGGDDGDTQTYVVDHADADTPLVPLAGIEPATEPL